MKRKHDDLADDSDANLADALTKLLPTPARFAWAASLFSVASRVAVPRSVAGASSSCWPRITTVFALAASLAAPLVWKQANAVPFESFVFGSRTWGGRRGA